MATEHKIKLKNGFAFSIEELTDGDYTIGMDSGDGDTIWTVITPDELREVENVIEQLLYTV